MENNRKKNLASTQAFLPIKEIRENTLIMNDNSLRAVIMVSSVNFSLKSTDERNAIIANYQRFLNSLEYPIQILATSKNLNLESYLSKLEGIRQNQANALMKLQTEEYIKFIRELLQVSNIMEKRFYVVVPYYLEVVEAGKGMLPFGGSTKKTGININDFESYRVHMAQRVDAIVSGLSEMNLRAVQLGTEGLIELLYTTYNPETNREQKIGPLEDFQAPFVQSVGEESQSIKKETEI